MSRAEARAALEAALTGLRGALPQMPALASAPPSPEAAQQALEALTRLAQTHKPKREAPPPPKPILRCLHHLACTGGTLLSRAVAAQPNVALLSEIDPLSPMAHRHAFVPTDMVGLAKFGSRPASAALQSEIFLAGLAPLQEDNAAQGLLLVLRDHAHGKYSYGADVQARPNLRAILQRQYDLRSIVTVRDPVDSYLALQHNGWVDFTPSSFDEYCRRVRVFLEDHAGIEVLRYEDFVADPAARAQRICQVLDLPFNPEFADLMPALRLSGDSGRRGARISARPRRAMSDALRAEVAASPNYAALIAQLGYVALPEAPEMAAVSAASKAASGAGAGALAGGSATGPSL